MYFLNNLFFCSISELGKVSGKWRWAVRPRRQAKQGLIIFFCWFVFLLGEKPGRTWLGLFWDFWWYVFWDFFFFLGFPGVRGWGFGVEFFCFVVWVFWRDVKCYKWPCLKRICHLSKLQAVSFLITPTLVTLGTERIWCIKLAFEKLVVERTCNSAAFNQKLK